MKVNAALQFYDVYHTKDVNLLDRLLAPEYIGQVNGREIKGAEAAKQFITAFLSAFPDVQYTIHDTVTDGDKVVTRWTATATHAGDFAGIAPTQKRIQMFGITIFHIVDGRIAALWNSWDVFGLMQQLQAA
jgi:steroid delta-isomerase-like uncharacterized protein